MKIFQDIVFAIVLSILMLHEMDAIMRKEWRMFKPLRNFNDKQAYAIFLLFHVPLYAAVFFMMMSPYAIIVKYIADIFMVVHLFVHMLFRKHKYNEFNNKLSSAIIYLAAIFAFIHLLLVLIA